MPPTKESPAQARPWLTAGAIGLIGVLVAMTMVSQFYRNAIGVLAPDLVRELTLSPAEIGLLTSVFFLVFAVAQIPIGVALDRFGPAAVMALSCALALVGVAIFAAASGPVGLIAGRIVMGLGCASFLMAPLAIYARLYPPDRFSTLAGIQLGLGSLGALLSTAPFAALIAITGWRTAFAATGLVVALAAVIVYVALRGTVAGGPTGRRESMRESLGGVREVARQTGALRLFLMHCVAYSTFVTMLGLWGGAWLAHMHGLSLSERGQVLFVFAAAQITGLLTWGPSDRLFGGYRTPITIGASASACLLLLLAFGGPFPLPLTILWFALFGYACAYTPVLLAHGKSIFPDRLVGRGMTVMNIGTMGGAFVFQTLTGWLVGLYAAPGEPYPLEAYRLIFTVQAVAVVGILILYRTAPDPRRTT
jgi:MFS family permease